MGLRAERYSDPSYKKVPSISKRDADQEFLIVRSPRPVGAFRGLLIASLLAAAFWIGVYFLLR